MADFCPHGCYWDCEHRSRRVTLTAEYSYRERKRLWGDSPFRETATEDDYILAQARIAKDWHGLGLVTDPSP